jgi:MFS transporter, Spinster family, sphingosine-1-phosphate transporter
MVVVYMVFAVIFGVLADKELMDRRYILSIAVIFWSVFTALAGLANNIAQLVLLRSLVGVGEAAYGTIAPPMISDFYPESDRNVAYGIYYLAIPLGGALGYGIGAVLGGAYSWRVAFVAIGIPGILVGIAILSLNDPKRGINDNNEHTNNTNEGSSSNSSTDSYGVPSDDYTDQDAMMRSVPPLNSTSDAKAAPIGEKLGWKAEVKVLLDELKEILSNKHFMFALGGQTAGNFALGGLAEWFATYLLRFENADISTAGLIAGAATVVGGLAGNIIGAKVADYFQPKVKSAYFLIPALFTIPAAVFLLLAVNISNNLGAVTVLLFIAEIFTWTYLAPISALSINVMRPELRARSCGEFFAVQGGNKFAS